MRRKWVHRNLHIQFTLQGFKSDLLSAIDFEKSNIRIAKYVGPARLASQ
jgi:hypothetical protein